MKKYIYKGKVISEAEANRILAEKIAKFCVITLGVIGGIIICKKTKR